MVRGQKVDRGEACMRSKKWAGRGGVLEKRGGDGYYRHRSERGSLWWDSRASDQAQRKKKDVSHRTTGPRKKEGKVSRQKQR